MRSILVVGLNQEDLDTFSKSLSPFLNKGDVTVNTLALPPSSAQIGYPVEFPFAKGCNILYSDYLFLSKQTKIVYLNNSSLENCSVLESSGRFLSDSHPELVDKIY